MKRPLGIYVLCAAVLASLAGAMSCWSAIVPRLISGPGPKSWVEWVALAVLTALPFSVPPAAVGAWQRSHWAPGAVLIWGSLWIGEMALTFLAAGALAGISGPEWFLPWVAVLGCALGLGSVVRYVGRAVSAAAGERSRSST